MSILSDLKSGKYFQVALGLADVYVNTGFFLDIQSMAFFYKRVHLYHKSPLIYIFYIHSPLIHLRLPFYILNPLAKLDLNLRRKRRFSIKLACI